MKISLNTPQIREVMPFCNGNAVLTGQEPHNIGVNAKSLLLDERCSRLCH